MLYICAIVVGGALLAPPLWWLGQWAIRVDWIPQLAPFGFDKYFNRAALLITIVGLPLLLRSYRIESLSQLGLQTNPNRYRHFGLGLVVGFLGLGILVASLIATGQLAFVHWPHAMRFFYTLQVAIIVGTLEEFLFRGVLFGVLRRSLSIFSATFLLSILFGALHFLRPNPNLPKITEVSWRSGLELVPHLFWEFSQPQRLYASLLTLTCMSWVLCRATVKTRSVALGIGLHAGWVWGLKLLPFLVKHTCANVWLGQDMRSGLAPLILMLGTWGIVHVLRFELPPVVKGKTQAQATGSRVA